MNVIDKYNKLEGEMEVADTKKTSDFSEASR